MGITEETLVTFRCNSCSGEWVLKRGVSPYGSQVTGELKFQRFDSANGCYKNTIFTDWWLCDKCTAFLDKLLCGEVEITSETMYKLGGEFFNRTWTQFCAMQEYLENEFAASGVAFDLDVFTSEYKERHNIRDE